MKILLSNVKRELLRNMRQLLLPLLLLDNGVLYDNGLCKFKNESVLNLIHKNHAIVFLTV